MLKHLFAARCALFGLAVFHKAAKLVQTSNSLYMEPIPREARQRFVKVCVGFEKLLRSHGHVTAIGDQFLLFPQPSKGSCIDHKRRQK
ncbi:hypothetical protein D3C80_1931400 [compost metagenome]